MEKGYIAISSLLVIAAVVLVVGISVAYSSVDEVQVALSSKKGRQTLDLVEGCVEDALLYLNERNELPSNIILPEGECSVVLVNQLGTVWTFQVQNTQTDYQKTIRIQADRDSSLSVLSWQEE